MTVAASLRPTEKRLALAARVAELRADGLTHREIAVRLGISRSYAAALDTDPDGSAERERKRGYSGTCSECGGPTDGSAGRANAPTLCNNCQASQLHEERYWTRERIIAAFQAYHARTGRSPRITDRTLAPSVRRKLSPERLEAQPADDRSLPVCTTVVREFGSWPAALEAAGLPLNSRGGLTHVATFHRTEARLRMLTALAEAGEPLTIHALKERLGVERSGAHSCMLGLRDLGLVEWKPRAAERGYRGRPPGLVRLTDAGRRELERWPK